jgi:hypothetical protein
VYLFDQKQLGDSLTVKIWRAGKEMELSGKARRIPDNDHLRLSYDTRPHYLVYGGMLFMPLDLTLFSVLEGSRHLQNPQVRSNLLWNLVFRAKEQPATSSREVVVMVRIFRHQVNSQMFWTGPVAVSRVNGRDIQSLKDLAESLSANQGPFQTFEFEPFSGLETLDRAKADAAQKEILEQYGITSDRNL